jgi:hypothetical protein
VVERAHADLLRLLALVADVDVRGGIVAHQHCREARHVATASGGELPHPLGDPLAHLGGDRLPVDLLRSRHLLSGRVAISFRSAPSPAKRTTTTDPASTEVTTPSPKLAWTTSSPTA